MGWRHCCPPSSPWQARCKGSARKRSVDRYHSQQARPRKRCMDRRLSDRTLDHGGLIVALDIHFHILFLDGIYVYCDDRPLPLRHIKAPDIGERELIQLITQRVGRCLERRSLQWACGWRIPYEGSSMFTAWCGMPPFSPITHWISRQRQSRETSAINLSNHYNSGKIPVFPLSSVWRTKAATARIRRYDPQ
jgi:hypothetical protein